MWVLHIKLDCCWGPLATLLLHLAGAVACLQHAVSLYTDMGRLGMAARQLRVRCCLSGLARPRPGQMVCMGGPSRRLTSKSSSAPQPARLPSLQLPCLVRLQEMILHRQGGRAARVQAHVCVCVCV